MGETEHLDQFFSKLMSDKVMGKIIGDINSERQRQIDGGWLGDKPFAEADYPQRIDFDLYRTFAGGQLTRSFNEHLLSQFTFPPLTAGELGELACDHFAGAYHAEELSAALFRLSAHVGRLTTYTADDFNICFDVAKVSGAAFDIPHEMRDCPRLFESPHGFWISFSESGNPFSPATIDLSGKFSELALKEVSVSVARIATSASRTVHLVNCDPKLPDVYGYVPFEVSQSAVWDDFKRLGKSFFSHLISSYFLAPVGKTSTLDQRLRNAAHLLAEADSQDSAAISLSLSFSAIEAIVCSKTDGIVDELSRNVASLLEPDKLKRIDAIAAIKSLYNLRSKTLHGASVNGDDKARWKARTLAAAIVRAVYEWQEHIARMGECASRDGFLCELKSLSVTGSQMVGVSERLSRFIPTNDNW
ncbi:hypothetical protein [Rosistilla oblonga]|uniref:hypothetical protein n=1 Tax=Rosistilla oblonga TaxID=2527990 RepID=UPI003A97B7EA